MTRPILVLIFFGSLVLKIHSQPPLAWAGQVDSKNQIPDWSHSITGVDVDLAGNMFMAGQFSDTMDVDPSSLNSYLGSNHANGAGYILKFSSSGKLTWAKEITLTDSASLNMTTIKVDTLGNVYVAGEFLGTVDFDPGPATYSLNGYDDGFVMKLDQAGNFLWAKQFMTTPGSKLDAKYSVVREITFDNKLNPCLVGVYANGSVDMDPGSGTFYLQSKALCNVFVTKLNTKGDLQWAKSFEGVSFVYDIKYDKNQNIFFCGTTGSGADFDPGNPVVSSKGTAGYLCKLDSAGNFTKAMFFEGNCLVTSVVISDKILFAGHTYYATDLNPGANTYIINGKKGFFACLDTLGNFAWAKEIGAPGSQFPGSYIINPDIQLNAKKGLYLSWLMTGTCDFDPGNGSYTLSTSSLSSTGAVALSSYDIKGNFLWAHLVPDEYGFNGRSLSKVTPEGDIYSANLFSGVFDFDPDVTTYNLIPLNYNAICIRKLSNCKNPPSISLSSDRTEICKGEEIWLTASGGESYTWNYFQPVPVVITHPQTTTNYQVIGRDSAGCKSSAEILITVKECSSLQENEKDSNFIYPNPTTGVLYIKDAGNCQITISDATGKQVKVINMTNDQTNIDVSALSPGIYLVTYKGRNHSLRREKIILK